jgi:hypothetical protein
VEKARRDFSDHRFQRRHSADVLMRMQMQVCTYIRVAVGIGTHGQRASVIYW